MTRRLIGTSSQQSVPGLNCLAQCRAQEDYELEFSSLQQPAGFGEPGGKRRSATHRLCPLWRPG